MMKKFILTIIMFASYAYANPFGLTQAKIDEVANKTAWHRLLLYNNDKSDIKNPSFFLSDGNDPKKELQTLLDAWEQGDDRLCRFPARLHFIKQAFALDKPLPHCPNFEQWQQTINAKQLSLIFADEHPNNLASGFGHSFIKVDKVAGEPIAINYTPNYPNAEIPALGAYRSLMGHYEGRMEILPFAKKQADYLQKDERDLWQFELDLSKDELEQITRHLWEVKDMARPYYLTHDNCATEIVRLIDVVRPKLALSAKLGGITTPAKISQIIDQAGLIKTSIHLPATSTLRQAHYNGSSLAYTQGNPTTASPMHRLGISYQTDGQLGLSYRTAYHDVLDNPKGVREWLDLEILNAKISYDDKVRLNELTLIRQRSYNPKNSAKGYNGKASGFALGFEQANQNKTLVAQTSLEKGISWAIGTGQGGRLPDGLCYGFGTTMLQVGKHTKAGIGATVGCVYHMFDEFRAKAELKLPYWQGRRQGQFVPKLDLAMQYDLNRHSALRLSWQKDKYHDEANLAYQWYFD